MFWLSLYLKLVYLSFSYVIFVVIADVKHGTTSDLPRWMESQLSEGGPRDESDCYLTFSLASFLVLLLILSGDIELNPGPETVKY